ncbi:MAG: hypothetical protein GXP53_01105 [Deltaproteobacteria bacterium]|nr:hypothetical protein [Deltaproteobacteria bacterium]
MRKRLPATSRAGPLARLVVLFFLALVLFLPASSFAAPTLDGVIDSDYFKYGIAGNYYGFTPGASARLYVIDKTTVDPDYVWLACIGFSTCRFELLRL